MINPLVHQELGNQYFWQTSSKSDKQNNYKSHGRVEVEIYNCVHSFNKWHTNGITNPCNKYQALRHYNTTNPFRKLCKYLSLSDIWEATTKQKTTHKTFTPSWKSPKHLPKSLLLVKRIKCYSTLFENVLSKRSSWIVSKTKSISISNLKRDRELFSCWPVTWNERGWQNLLGKLTKQRLG